MLAARLTALTALALALAGLRAAGASGAGAPVLGTSGAAAVRSVDGVHYQTRIAGDQTRLTALTRTQRRQGILRGRFEIPVVAFDNSAGGLSADGRTLVLSQPRFNFPSSSTELAIVDTRTLRAIRYVRLRGDFAFDAISPNGAWVYLIHYTAPGDPTTYQVRAMSSATGRLKPGEIVDPHDHGDNMRGSPVSRVMSADGRWAYTLYDGGGHPFVHALDTIGLTARCLDLPVFSANADPFAARLGLTPGRLLVRLGQTTVSFVDLRTFKVSAALAPAAVHRAAASRPHASRPPGGALGGVEPWIAAALALVSGVVLLARRRPARARRVFDVR